MAADEKAPDETTEGSDGATTGPVAGEDSSSSQAAGEEPTPAPPVDEASEAPAAEAEAETSAEGQSSEEAEPEAVEADGADEEPEAESPAEEPEPDEEPVAEEAVTEEAEPAAEEPKAEEKKKDVIPGADLEPIAVEPEAQLSTEERARLEAEEEEKARREAALAGADEPDPADRAPAKMASDARFLATGKRKCSIARVIVLPGDGKVEINKRSLEEFFPRPLHQTMAVQPLVVSGYEGNVDVRIRVHGGGISGQAGAVRHGIARALTEIDPELRGDLKRRGFLTRDARVKERRKAGFKKARKKPQFSKR
jgi:small subunit ribosomal protein S9